MLEGAGVDCRGRCYVTPKKVEPLLICVWKDGSDMG